MMKGAAEFYADWLAPANDGSGELVTPVSTSPEHAFVGPDRHNASITEGTTMDLAIVREIFSRTIAAAELLGRDPALAAELRGELSRPAPDRVGARGQLQEWRADYTEVEPTHRHLSHLYSRHPGNRINPDTTPNSSAPSPAPSNCAATRRPAGRWAGKSISGPGCSTATTPTRSSAIS